MTDSIQALKTGTSSLTGSRFPFGRSRLLLLSISALGLCLTGCTLFASRPTQLMSDTSAAIRAAKGVQADTLAPELYRQANEWFFRAKHEYKFKNFKLAADLASKARLFAEQAEFQSLKNGGKFVEPPPPELPSGTQAAGPPPPDTYATPEPIPADRMEQQQNQQMDRTGNNGPVPLGTLPSP
ncbi:MAG TPA: hypothetical protein DCS07_01715 [Bdellovibrionales bacterium]|nr:MAG: hypothetical protein A2Z97_15380 [Bdellovibrionales bacterium GWB1_52_6]OFZ03956.1 MAG: hypothetical protein A2X97_08470 [Bdellovibrionales bacterium GWA1_52_35]OFZ37652.1 MAG: hypothetical protein A2070_00710 [Bdellovibrionales bacterium GWC1_52_8]HAR41341.1 hypothetical protein [Bdellovibrionales bacterium]HCM39769.1 hypothetical protein [Bdellovibrionales bacterium]